MSILGAETMKRRKARIGVALKEIQRVAPLRQQIADEKARHTAKVADFALQREQDRVSAEVGSKAIREVRRLHQQAEENRRHRAALKRLHGRIARR